MRTLALTLTTLSLFAQPAIRPVPPPGVELSPTDRHELSQGLDRLNAAIARIPAGDPLLPDVLIYREAVRYALTHNEFFKPEDIRKAHTLLTHGLDRARSLATGQAPWTHATGLIVRGYRSRVDDSIQPYGLVIPSSFQPNTPHRWRLDAWFHGRNETLSEVNFLFERETRPGEFTPPHTIVLHLYGRYCNASRFAGEVDFHEALAAVKQHYAIDENRILIRGFSMGGASAWDVGTHFAGDWAAVAPGAGFSEAKEFLNLDLTKPDAPFPWEQKLWRMYDATGYALNLANTTTVAYNGDQDRQKQAADKMEAALANEGITLTRITGPETGHRYHPQSKIEIEAKLSAAAALGRQAYPSELVFTTFTLQYNRLKWLEVDGLEQHWERARVEARLDKGVHLTTSNVTALTLRFGPGGAPFLPGRQVAIHLNGQTLQAPGPASDRSWLVHFRRTGNQWALTSYPRPTGLAKVPGLQGPVDHAFLDRFIIVRPTGKPQRPETAAWVNSEMERAIREWRKQFRGEPIVKDDSAITPEDIATSNLILWGDPGSNSVFARLGNRLPLQWTTTGLTFNGQNYGATHVPILIYPNPLNPARYVVLNSGFTFRDFDYLNNARQTPKLPDWAIIDTTTPPGPRYPGRIAAAGFFNEQWQ